MADAGGGSSSPTLEEYDVFLSFRGEDTRNNFTSHLHAALKRQNIKTYFDEESLERGKEISPDLLEAIQKSKISVIVFSKNYASSSWCLRELAHIVQCHQEKGQIVFPIFHEVDPSHVRKQDGSYGDAFVKHEGEDNVEEVKQWRDALRTSANLAGFDSQAIRPESKLIEDVVKAIWGKLCSSIISSGVESKGLFGFENQFKDIEILLSIDSPDVRVVGIWGMGGIGKTTLADRIFSRFYSHFEGRCHFIRNLREKSEKCELEKSRDELFSELLKEETANLGTPSIPDYTKERVSRTKVLIILDDVSDSKQLESLNIFDHVSDIGKQFGDGSRIVITTRDASVLRLIGANDFIYKVKTLKDDEGLQLFNLIAFRGNAPPSDYIELSYQVVKKVGGNPLAIKVLGSHLRSLRSPSKENWKMELDKLKEVPLDDIHKVLRISYLGLDDKEKNIFLDIACFFKGMSIDFIENILNCCGFFASTGIDKLIDKSLISHKNNVLDMHDLVQEMGWKIVREESKEPGERSRVWTTKEACHALMNNDKGSKTIEGIFLDLDGKEDVHLRSTVFQEMRNLRFLSFYGSHLLGGGSRVIYSPYHRRFKVSLEALEFLPDSLRYLEWHNYPLNSLPSNFKAQNLVVLYMPGSQLKQLWNGVQELNNLKIMDLRHSHHLTQIPDLSRAPNLESIVLQDCRSLIPISINYSRNLLDLGNLVGIKKLNLRGCANLRYLPPSIGNLLCLRELDLGETELEQLPESIGNLVDIKELNLSGCADLRYLPPSIGNLLCLRELDLIGTGLEELPESIGKLLRLECLYLNYSNIWKIPASIKRLPELNRLCATRCESLKFVSPPNRVLIQGLRDNDEIAEDSCECLCFDDCFELDKNAKLNIISCCIVPTEDEDEIPYSASVTKFFPGSEIPSWFDHQSEGASIHIKLPQNWHNSSFLGFVVCAVIREFWGGISPLECTIDLINAKERRDFGCKFDNCRFEHLYLFDSSHVCMWYEYGNYRDCADALEAEINFYLPVQEFSDKIERCGMRMLYREEVEKFSYLLLDQSADVTDQPEPSTRGTSVSVSEEPPSKRTKHSNSLLLSQDLDNSESF